MQDIFTQLKKAQQVKMTAHERADIRATLQKMTAGAGPHSEVVRSRPSPYMTTSPFSMFGMLTRAAVFVVVGFIAGGTSLSFASLQTLPGDALYPIKTTFVEKIGDTFAFSAEAKAQAQAKHIASRVQEITELKARGTMNDPIVAALAEAALTKSIATYKTELASLDQAGKNTRTKEIALATLTTLKTIAPEPQPVAAQPVQMMMAKSMAVGSAPAQPEQATLMMMSTTTQENPEGTPVNDTAPSADARTATMSMMASEPTTAPVAALTPQVSNLDQILSQAVVDLEEIVNKDESTYPLDANQTTSVEQQTTTTKNPTQIQQIPKQSPTINKETIQEPAQNPTLTPTTRGR